ncbi:MAG TPA: VOC family protein [Alphaproteobacteria bacterium]|nr:VOC family protein [Alphaproteobacteria bacterium]
MPKAIFVNLSCKDLTRSKTFFEALGFSFNPKFTNGEAACLVISDAIYAMLHTPTSFRRFTRKPIADAHETTEALLAIQVDSKDEVDGLMKKVLAAGGRESREPENHGFMYGRAFEDPDGHIWELFWMDSKAVPK